MRAAALLLADGRFPDGSHAHSGGVEAAVADGRIDDVASLRAFLHGRLWTVGLVDAALAAATAARAGGGRAVPWADLDAEAAARMPSTAARGVSRTLGRHLLRAARRAWDHPCLEQLQEAVPAGPFQPVALGAAAAAAGLDGDTAALLAAHAAVVPAASAATRLLGLDPYAVAGVVAGLGPDLDAVAARAGAAGRGELADLPAASAPLIDLAAEQHARWDTRLFAS